VGHSGYHGGVFRDDDNRDVLYCFSFEHIFVSYQGPWKCLVYGTDAVGLGLSPHGPNYRLEETDLAILARRITIDSSRVCAQPMIHCILRRAYFFHIFRLIGAVSKRE